MLRNGPLENPSQCEGFEIKEKGLGTSRAYVSGSGRQSCEPEFNYRMAERQKLIKISQCEIFMLRSLSPAKFIRLS